MAFKSHRENSLASLRGDRKGQRSNPESDQKWIASPITWSRNDVLYFSGIFKLSWGLCVR